MILVKTSYVKKLPPTIIFFLFFFSPFPNYSSFAKNFLASPDDKLCELLLDQNSFETTAGVQDPVRANVF